MPSYNRCILLGNVTRDIELRYTPGGTAVVDIGLAVNDKRKDAQGNWIEECTFVDCTAFGRTAEIAQEYLAKGNPVLIEGRLKLEQWEDKNGGGKRSKHKIIIDKLQLLLGSKNGGGNGGGGGNSGGGQQGSRQQQGRNQQQAPPDDYDYAHPPADEIPF